MRQKIKNRTQQKIKNRTQLLDHGDAESRRIVLDLAEATLQKLDAYTGSSLSCIWMVTFCESASARGTSLRNATFT